MNENNCLISISGHGHPEGAIIVDENKFRFPVLEIISLLMNPSGLLSLVLQEQAG
jgi:hypothetical protein